MDFFSQIFVKFRQILANFGQILAILGPKFVYFFVISSHFLSFFD